jgi:O-antigen/teichoic acid export membrane protein
MKTDSSAGKMLKHSTIYAIGNMSRQLVGFLMLPIYTQYLTPADYGAVGLLTLGVSLIEVILGVRLLQAISKFYYDQNDENDRKAVISGAIITTLTASCFATLLLYSCREIFAKILFDDIAYGLLVGIFSVQIVTNAIENYSLFYVRVQERPILFVAISLVKLATQLSLNIYFVVWMEMGLTGIAYSAALTSILFATILGLYTLRLTGLQFRWSLVRPMVIFSWPLWLAGLATLYIGSSSRVYIRIFSSLDEVGLYALGAKFGGILTILIWGPFSQYWQIERFKIYREDDAKRIYQNVFQFISTLLIIAVSGISIFSDTIIRIMSPQEFHGATIIVPFIAFAGLFSALTMFSNFSFLATNNTVWIAKSKYLLACIFTALYLVLIPLLGYLGAAISLVLGQFTQFLIIHIKSRKYYDMGLKYKPLALMIFFSLLGIFIANVYTKDENLIIEFFYKLLVFGASLFIILAVQLRNPVHKEYIFTAIRSHFKK